MNCSRTHFSRMVDYSAVVDGSNKLQNAIYLFVLGIRGRRENPVTYSQIRKWFHGTPEDFFVTNLNAICGDKIVLENGKYRVMTFRDHSDARKSQQVVANG